MLFDILSNVVSGKQNFLNTNLEAHFSQMHISPEKKQSLQIVI